MTNQRRSTALRAAAGALAALAILAQAPAQAHVVSCGRSSALGGEWRQYGNQLTGDRTQEQEFFLDTDAVARLAPAWTFDANEESLTQNNEITGYPIVADGCVYVASSTGFQTPGWVFAINADTGELVWRTLLDRGVYSSLAVEDGLVYAFVSRVKLQGDTTVGGPYVIALDQATGDEVWRTTVDHQVGADAVSSPVVFDGMVWVGVSGTAAEVSEGDRGLFQGNSVLLEANDLDGDGIKGEILSKAYTIPEDQWEDGFAGGGQWGTIAIDPDTSYGYVGTGNPFDYDKEHERTNSVIKLDVARARDANGAPVPSVAITNPAFGTVVGSYKGNVDEFFPGLTDTLPCQEIEDIGGVFGFGLGCLRLDLDFGGQPNLFDIDGREVVGLGQKSGVYHVFDADTMEPVWASPIGAPTPVGGIVGPAAFDGNNIYGPHTVGGYLWSMTRDDGTPNYITPTLDVLHYGPAVTMANGILYTVDLKGFLDAYDAATGLPILHRPMFLGADTHLDPIVSWGGTTIARNTVFASVGLGITSAEFDVSLPNGFVIAFRPVQPPL